MATRRKSEGAGDDPRTARSNGDEPRSAPSTGETMAGPGGRGMPGRAMQAESGAAGMPGAAMRGSQGGSPSGKGKDSPPPGGMPGTGRSSGPGSGGGGLTGAADEGAVGEAPRRRCATMDVHRRLLSESPGYRQARNTIETLTRSLLTGRAGERFTGVVRIPVVVHVVWKDAGQNISDAQVLSQIDVLNRDFRATNTDIGTVPAAFQPLIADSRVEFFLATTDPNGNPTNGITRTPTAVASFSSDDKIKKNATGGADAWPANRYLNVWTGQLGGGLLGYAQFPGGPADTDGVVILHSAFGTTGTATPPFHLGRSATHEIGHYLNLFHIWGDDGTGCGGSDEVDDTPNQAGPNFGTPTFPHVTCNNGPNGDLFMDYMDYVDDAAMVMFTKGQAARMEACLDGVRSALPIKSQTPRPAGPVVSWGSNRLDAFVLGTDRALYHKWFDGNAWGPSVADYEYMGGVCMEGPEVASWGPDRLDAFVLGTDRALYHKWWDGNAWGPSVTDYEYMGGVCLDGPVLASWGPNRLDAFVLGTDRALYHKWFDGNAWGPSTVDYEYMGGVCIEEPDVVAWGPNRLDVFVIGSDSALYHKWFDGNAWGPSTVDYEYMGGVCVGPPTAVAWGPNRLDVFVIGTDSALYHKWWDGTAWGPSLTGYESLGGVCASRPAVVSWGAGRLDIFVVGTDSALYHKWFDGNAWGPSLTGYEYLGGVIAGDPRVVSWGPDRLDVFVEGTDSALYHKWWDGQAWGPSLTGYESLGGVLSGFREEQPEPAAAEPAGKSGNGVTSRPLESSRN